MARPEYFVRKSSTNYELIDFEIERKGNDEINSVTFFVSKTTSALLVIGDDVSIGYMDGVTFVPEFSGDIVGKSENETGKFIMESYGGRLNRTSHFSQIWTDTAPEEIMEDIIDTYVTTLNYASTATSGVTIEKFVVKNETPAEAAGRLVELLQWQMRTDNDKNFYFEPEGTTSNPNVLTVGTNCYVDGNWNYTPNSIINILTLIGGKALFNTIEEFTATASQTEFVVTKKIAGNIKITDNGTEVVGGVSGSTTTYDYTVESDDKTITFEVGRTNGHTILIQYSYEVPVKITARNEESITANTAFSRKITDTTIVTMADARKKSKKILETYSTLTKNAMLLVEYDTDYAPGETVRVIDAFNNIDQQLVIDSTNFVYRTGKKTINVGTPPISMYEWQKGIDARLRALEQNQDNSDLIQHYKNFQENVDINIRVGRVRAYSVTLGNSWIVGSATNGLVGTNTTTEGGGQQVVGASSRDTTLASVVNYNDRFYERFNFTTYIDTGSTTADVDTVDNECGFTASEILVSEIVALDGTTWTKATMTVDDDTNLTLELSADGGSNWEEVTNATEHTFTNTGTELMYKLTASNNATVTYLYIDYE